MYRSGFECERDSLPLNSSPLAMQGGASMTNALGNSSGSCRLQYPCSAAYPPLMNNCMECSGCQTLQASCSGFSAISSPQSIKVKQTYGQSIRAASTEKVYIVPSELKNKEMNDVNQCPAGRFLGQTRMLAGSKMFQNHCVAVTGVQPIMIST